MSIFQFILIYVFIGTLFGISIETLMIETKLNDTTTNFERFTWIIFWPIYILLFLIGMKK